MKTKHFFSIVLLMTICWSCNNSGLKQPSLLGGKPLPATYCSPDGYTIGPDGYLYVSINQSGCDWQHPGKIARISPDEKIEDFFILPVNEKTKKASPLGIVFATDGNLYISDNQSFCTDEPNQAGVIRVIIENGKPKRGELVVSGFNMSNGITTKGNYLYVAETNLGTTDKHTSGVYRFALDELISGDTLMVTGYGDPHLILTFETKNKDHKVGANGVAIDAKGNLYVNDFGDMELMKYMFDAQGKVVSEEIFCKPEGVLSLDGMQIDQEGNIWIADFRGNTIIMVDPETKKSTIIAKNEIPATGENGKLDTPSECIRWGDKVFVSNINTTYGPHTAGSLQSISVISLK